MAPAPAVTYAAPAPVIEHVAPASAVTCAALSPVIEYVRPAPADTYATPAPVTTYVMPSPVTECIAQAPPVAISTPSQQLPPAFTMAAVSTGVNLDTAGLVNPRCSITAVEASAQQDDGSISSLDEFTARVQQNP